MALRGNTWQHLATLNRPGKRPNGVWQPSTDLGNTHLRTQHFHGKPLHETSEWETLYETFEWETLYYTFEWETLYETFEWENPV